jgi:hypothetical protein
MSEVLVWIELAQDIVYWGVLLKTALKLCVS